MSSSITQLPAASNGTDTTTDAVAEREHGINRVQEQLVYHVSALSESVLREAQQLMSNLNRTVLRRTTDYDGSKGTAPVDMANVAAIIGETLDCIDVASEQLSRLNVDIRMRLNLDGF
jgi:hypothetical protein